MPINTKPSHEEDEYFAHEEIESKRRLAFKQAEETAAKQKQELQALHFMKCPKCGMDLHALNKGKVVVDTCFNCKGVFLESGELEALMKQGNEAPKIMDAVLNLFRGR